MQFMQSFGNIGKISLNKTRNKSPELAEEAEWGGIDLPGSAATGEVLVEIREGVDSKSDEVLSQKLGG